MAGIFDHYIRHAISVERFTIGQTRKMVGIVNSFDDIASTQISQVLQSYESGHLTREALESTLNDVIVTYSNSATAFTRTLSADLADFIESEHIFQTGSLNAFTKAEILPINAISSQQIIQLASNTSIQNASLNAWVESISATKAQKLTSATRLGIITGQPVNTISANLSGTINLSKNQMRSLVRTSVQSASAVTRNAVFQENSDIVSGIIWLSTLDNRTTTSICAPRDTRKFTLDGQPIGHNYVWLGGPGQAHWQCRSTGVPDIGDDFVGRRPAISAGENYEEGDDTTRTGKVAKPTKSRRENGTYKVERVNSSTNYEKWLIKQPAAFQNDILGPTRGELFRSGELSLEDMSDRFGSSITLDELEAQNLIDIGDS